MSSRVRRSLGLAATLSLVVGMAACGPDDGEVSPAEPAPTVTAEPEPVAQPGSRVPLTCDELATVPSEFSTPTVIDDESVPFCEASVEAQRYTAVVNMFSLVDGVTADRALSALSGLLRGLVTALDAAGEPLPAWEPEGDVLAYPSDCEAGLRPLEGPIVAALPFESGSASAVGSGDGAFIYGYANSRVSLTWCAWSGPQASLDLRLLPGAAWAVDAGLITIDGRPVDVDGADSARVLEREDSSLQVQFIADSSVGTVTYSPDDTVGAPNIEATLIAVVEAIIATGPRT